jgi:Carboxypeptidase regulatory-like domain
MKILARGALAVLVALAAFTGCNSDNLPPAAGYAALSGTVVDRTSNQPIAGALVTVDTVITATTDATGTFKIDKVPSGIVDYTVQAQGYALLEATTNVEPGKPAQLSVVLDSHPAATAPAP